MDPIEIIVRDDESGETFSVRCRRFILGFETEEDNVEGKEGIRVVGKSGKFLELFMAKYLEKKFEAELEEKLAEALVKRLLLEHFRKVFEEKDEVPVN